MLDILKGLEKELIDLREESNFWDRRFINTMLRNLESINYLPNTQNLFIGDRWLVDDICMFISSKKVES